MRISEVHLAGDRIVGELRQPKPSKQLIVICHGYHDSRANPTIVAIVELLNRQGHTTFAFNFSPSEGGIDIEQQVSDILSIVQHFYNYDKTILIAASFAALSATIATTKSPKIKGLVTISGFFGRGELGDEHRRDYLIFRLLALVHPRYHRIYHYLKQALRPEAVKVPVLVFHSQSDKVVRITQSQRFYAQLTGTKQFVTLKTAAHNIPDDADRQLIVDEIDSWLRTTM